MYLKLSSTTIPFAALFHICYFFFMGIGDRVRLEFFPLTRNSCLAGPPIQSYLYFLITVTTSTFLVTNVLAKYFRSYDKCCKCCCQILSYSLINLEIYFLSLALRKQLAHKTFLPGRKAKQNFISHLFNRLCSLLFIYLHSARTIRLYV